jgi:hypothetical protein
MRQQDERNITKNLSNLKYYFITAAIDTAIAGIVHLYMPLMTHPQMLNNTPFATFSWDLE